MNGIRRMAVMGITLIGAIAFAIVVSAQEKKITKKDVPQAVISAFEKAYPEARIKGYSTESESGKTYFEIESMRDKMTLDVSYLSDGTAAEIEEAVAAKDLPTPVMEAIKAKYAKGKIAKAEKKTVGTLVTYEMRVTTGKASVGLEIDPSGKIVKESMHRSKKEGKEEKEEKEEDD